MEAFEPFSAMHGVAAGTCIAGIVALVLAGRAERRRGRERRLRCVWIASIVLVQAAILVLSFQPSRYDPRYSWPLHVCDWAAVAAILCLARGGRITRALTYFWGVGLCTQAYVTPTLREGPAHVAFWLFWAMHLQIVGSAVYDVAVLGFRPTARDLAIAAIGTFLYGVLVLPIDLAFDLNYGFLGAAGADRTVLAWLGPWPWRTGSLYGLVLIAFFAIWVVWPLWRRVRRES